MDDEASERSGRTAETKTNDWERTVSLDEAQQTAREADPDDLGGTSPSDGGLTAGGDGTAVEEGDPGAGGAPYSSGYVTGGAHHPTIADLPPTREDE